MVDLLAAAAPDLAAAVATARRKAYVILDGTLVAIDRVGMRTKDDRPYYSGKHKRHGLNVQVLADPAGRLIWASPALPGFGCSWRTLSSIDVLKVDALLKRLDGRARAAGSTRFT